MVERLPLKETPYDQFLYCPHCHGYFHQYKINAHVRSNCDENKTGEHLGRCARLRLTLSNVVGSSKCLYFILLFFLYYFWRDTTYDLGRYVKIKYVLLET